MIIPLHPSLIRDCVAMSKNPIIVILNPSPAILNEVKNLCLRLRINSAKNLKNAKGYKLEILRLMPQNDITAQSLRGGITSLYENAAECPVLWAGMNAAI